MFHEPVAITSATFLGQFRLSGVIVSSIRSNMNRVTQQSALSSIQKAPIGKNPAIMEFSNLVVSLSCPTNSPWIAQPYRCRVSGATGANDYTPTPHESNKNSQSNYKTTEFTTGHRSRYQ